MNLNQVTIYSEIPIETVNFYKKLGLKIIVDSLPRYARLECPDGESTLSIHTADTPVQNNGVVLYFECDDLDSEVERLKHLGLLFDAEPIDKSWLWREAYLKDPNSNTICLYNAGENRQNPPWRVK